MITAGAAIVLWIALQLTDWTLLQIAAIPAKLVLLGTTLFFISDLSRFLHRRPLVAMRLGAALVTATLIVAMLYLPWRETFTRHFSNSRYRWYYSTMPADHPGPYGDFDEWQKQWHHGVPHAIEAGILIAYYSLIIAACTLSRLRRPAGVAVGLAGLLLLMIVPLFTRLIEWDYDVFLRGVIFDSISLDLFPTTFWFAGDYSIFLDVFLLVYFGVCGAFHYTRPAPCPLEFSQANG